MLTLANDAEEFELHVGDTLEVALDSNPSTGYTWTIDDLAGNTLEPIGESQLSSTSNLPGEGGVETFRFKAVTQGGGDLTLSYLKIRDDDAETTEFSVTIVVSP